MANSGSASLSIINTAAQVVVATIPLPTPTPGGPSGAVEFGPVDVAITPDHHFAYVGTSTNKVFVIDTGLKTLSDTIEVTGTRDNLQITPPGIAITPDKFAYVTNFSTGNVSIIDLATNSVSNSITVAAPEGIAVTPDGSAVYVAGVAGLTVIKTDTQSVQSFVGGLKPPPTGMAITPNGTYAYATQLGDGTNDKLTIIRTGISPLPAFLIPPAPNARGPAGIAFTPDSAFAYVANRNSNTVSVIRTAPTPAITTTIDVEMFPMGVALTGTGSLAFVTNFDSDSVSVIDTSTNTVLTAIPVGIRPNGIAIASVPNGCPVCRGDCDADGMVTIDELMSGVAIALDSRLYSACPTWDGNNDKQVTVDEIVTGIDNALNSCP